MYLYNEIRHALKDLYRKFVHEAKRNKSQREIVASGNSKAIESVEKIMQYTMNMKESQEL